MTRIRQAVYGIRGALASPFVAVAEWQAEIPAEGRVVLVGLLLLTVGLAPALGLAAAIVPGLIVVSVGIGINYRHPLTAAVLIVGATAILVVAIARGAV